MKPYKGITLTPDPESERLVQEHLEEFQSTYQWRHVRNICHAPDVKSMPPFRDFCGILYHPKGGYIIFCDTLGKGYRDWLRKHPDIVYTYHNGLCAQFIAPGANALPTLTVMEVKYSEPFPRNQLLKPNVIWEMLDAGNTLEFIAQLYNTDMDTIKRICKKKIGSKWNPKNIDRTLDIDD